MNLNTHDRDAMLAESAEIENLGFDLGVCEWDSETLYPRVEPVDQLARALLGGNLHPVLLGEPGVGKTSVVATLARAARDKLVRCIHGQAEIRVPDELIGRRIVQVSVPDILAGALYVNHLEHKLKLIVANCRKTGAILFLDNVASFAGAGACTADPESDVANLLVPFLARGALRVIAAATPEDWMLVGRLRPAFARLFTPLRVTETTPAETDAVLATRSIDWSRRYQVRFGPGAIAEATDLADRLYPWKRFPGKACDLIESVLASRSAGPRQAGDPPGTGRHDRPIQRPPAEPEVLRGPDIADGVRRLTGLPEFLLVPTVPASREALLRAFRERVVGQQHVIDPLIDRVQMLKARLCAPGRPVAAWLFTGPTGVGKTLVARTLAAVLLGDERRLIRFDMSEFCTADSVSRFLGESRISRRSPGLVDAVLAEVLPVILLDEIEKAHRTVFDVLLQALGEGRVTDDSHRTAHLTNALVIMTSNLGTDRLVVDHPRPPSASAAWDQRVREAVRRHFRPEFLNRLTGVYTFLPLGPAEVDAIARREVLRLAERHGLAARSVRLRLTQGAFDAVLRAGHSPEFGVRPMERAVDHLVGTAVGRFLAENPAAGGCTLVLEVEDKSVAGVPNGVAAPPGTRPLRVVPARATGAAGTPPAT